MEYLPLELLQKIFGYCSRDALLAISLVNRRWTDAVDPVLAARSCLKVSYCIEQNDLSVQIDKELLAKSQRRYSCIRVGWGDSDSRRTIMIIQQLLDLCQERFSLQRLFLRAIPNDTLERFFSRRHNWLQNLTELYVELGSARGESNEDAICEIFLPRLKKLTWMEIETPDLDDLNTWQDPISSIFFDEWFAFAVDAPELEQVCVRINSKLVRIPLESRQETSDVCCLFLPSLELKIYDKLKSIEIIGLYELNQCHVDSSERLLRHIQTLSFTRCHSHVIQQICLKCHNLKELTIDEPQEGLLSFQVTPTLMTLEKFAFKNIYHSFPRNDNASFPKLKTLILVDMCIGLFLGNVPIDAPELETLILTRSNYGKLRIQHKDQIRTLAIKLDTNRGEIAQPPPNITELLLRIGKDDTSEQVRDYLRLFPKLKRLTLTGNGRKILDGMFLRTMFPYLEHFHGHLLTVELEDLQQIDKLKSIILSASTLKMSTQMRHLTLTGVEYFRVDSLTVDDPSVREFPIQINKRQVPIELSSPNGGCLRFSSLNYRMQLAPDFQHIVVCPDSAAL
ncbi:uncharacterized protein LOC129746298 [Uranotaenia lowii]|uniref:uncharacterized protein LOC129746298 n=1 Tax=Uranotaenia lowii TaxID=190385 RepID=UPI00247AEA1D|nr:uncharacterized protein LOC129746298 [Uranotaenia lowii]